MAILFTGTEYCTLADGPPLTGSVTIHFWAKPTVASTEVWNPESLLGVYSNSIPEILGVDVTGTGDSGNGYVTWCARRNSTYQHTDSELQATDTWVPCWLVYNGSTVRLFVDDPTDAGVVETISSGFTDTGTLSMTWACRPGTAGSFPFHGALGRVSVWTSALSEAERQAEEAAGLTLVKTASIFGHYVNDAGGTLGEDTSGNGNDMTLVNSPSGTTDPTYPSGSPDPNISGSGTFTFTGTCAIFDANVPTDRDPIGYWRSIPGKNIQVGDTARCLVSARCESGISYVRFAVSINGVFDSNTDVTDKAIWVPNDTDIVDPIGNCTSGPARLLCYGMEVDPVALSLNSDDYVDVVVTIHPVDGNDLVLKTHRFYYDATPPCSSTIYWGDGGSDAADGTTSGNRVLSFSRALYLLNTGGAIGGGTICVVGTGSVWQSATNYFETPYTSATASDNWWVTVQPAPGSTYADTFIEYNTPASDCESTNKLFLHFRDLSFRGIAVYFPAHNGSLTFWMEGCHATPLDPTYGPGETSPHVEAIEQVQSMVSITAAYCDGTYYTGCVWENIVGFGTNNAIGDTINRGFKFLNCAGVGLYKNNGSEIAYGPGEFRGQRGYVDMLGASDVTGGTNFDIIQSPTFSGKVRVRSLVADGSLTYVNGYNGQFEDRFASLVGATKWGVYLTGFSGYSPDTYAVLGAGTYAPNNYGYVDLDATYVSPVTGSSSAQLATALIDDLPGVGSANQLYTVNVHSNCIYHDGTVPQNVTIEDVAIIDNRDARQIVIDTDDSGGSIYRHAWVNCTGEARIEIDVGLTTGQVDHMIIEHCNGYFWYRAANGNFVDSTFANNIVTGWNISGLTQAQLESSLGSGCHHNHFESAADSIGVSATDGATIWTDGDPFGNGVWTLDAGSGAVGSASVVVGPSPWDSEDKGVYGGVVVGDWEQEASAGSDIAGSGVFTFNGTVSVGKVVSLAASGQFTFTGTCTLEPISDYIEVSATVSAVSGLQRNRTGTRRLKRWS